MAAARASVERSSASLQAAQSNYDKLVNRTDLTLGPEYASLQAARSSYQTALSNYVNRTAPPNPLDVSNAQASVTSAQASLDSARTRLVEVLRGPDPLDVAIAQNQVTSAQAALDAARARLNEVQNPTLASVDLSPLQSSVESARANLQAARARLAQVMQSQASAAAAAGAASRPSQQSGSGPSDIASAESVVRAAESSLALAESNLRKATEVPAPNSTDVLVAQQAVTQAETAYRNAVNNLQKLLQGLAADQAAMAQQAVTSAEGLLQTARNNLEKLLAGPAAEDVAAAKASLDTAQSNLETAQANWDRLTSLTDLESRPEYTQLMSARADHQTALSTYNTRTAGPRNTDVATAQAAVDAANSTLNSSLARLAQVLGGALPTDMGIAREAVATAELAVKQAQNDLDNAVLRAPFRGTVVSVGVNPGDQVGASTAAFSLLDPELIRVDASVDESNVIKLKPGMAVNVSFDALQGRQFAGVVATVTPAGVTQQGVVTFPVTVVFNGQGFTIPPGTTATLRVVTESKPNVLVVPSRAVVRQSRQTFVNVLVNGKPEPRAVRTGITGDNVTEILEGLEDGETIVISAPQTGGGQTGTFGAGGLPGLGTGAPGAPAPQPARR